MNIDTRNSIAGSTLGAANAHRNPDAIGHRLEEIDCRLLSVAERLERIQNQVFGSVPTPSPDSVQAIPCSHVDKLNSIYGVIVRLENVSMSLADGI